MSNSVRFESIYIGEVIEHPFTIGDILKSHRGYYQVTEVKKTRVTIGMIKAIEGLIGYFYPCKDNFIHDKRLEVKVGKSECDYTYFAWISSSMPSTGDNESAQKWDGRPIRKSPYYEQNF